MDPQGIQPCSDASIDGARPRLRCSNVDDIKGSHGHLLDHAWLDHPLTETEVVNDRKAFTPGPKFPGFPAEFAKKDFKGSYSKDFPGKIVHTDKVAEEDMVSSFAKRFDCPNWAEMYVTISNYGLPPSPEIPGVGIYAHSKIVCDPKHELHDHCIAKFMVFADHFLLRISLTARDWGGIYFNLGGYDHARIQAIMNRYRSLLASPHAIEIQGYPIVPHQPFFMHKTAWAEVLTTDFEKIGRDAQGSLIVNFPGWTDWDLAVILNDPITRANTKFFFLEDVKDLPTAEPIVDDELRALLGDPWFFLKTNLEAGLTQDILYREALEYLKTLPANGPADVNSILQFWFGYVDADGKNMALWFMPGTEADALIQEKFGAMIQEAANGKLEVWEDSPRSCLALVILTGSLTRNAFRGTAEAFRQDDYAMHLAKTAWEKGWLQAPKMAIWEVCWFAMCFQHMECPEHQKFGLRLLRDPDLSQVVPELQQFTCVAEEKLEILKTFKRFPWRNAVLGRVSTEEEQAWLSSASNTFYIRTAMKDAERWYY